MNTPLLDAVTQYTQAKKSRFHTPGHKGIPLAPFGEIMGYDVTELPETDSLYEACAAIAETEAHYSNLYATQSTLLSAGGSTLCIQTMLALVAKPGAKIICGRGLHTSAVNAMALLGLEPVWIFPETDSATGLAHAASPEQVAHQLQSCPQAVAVYLTSPDYFGIMSDIASISALCRRHNIPLLVDNAHGAHLAFLSPNRHPIALGADMCCDSLHKTLPVLTGGALLHIASARFIADAKRCMSLFGTTSPSYLIMLSADAALPWLQSDAHRLLSDAARQIAALETLAVHHGLLLPCDKQEPLRLSIGYAPTGMDKPAFHAHLDRYHVAPEYLSDHFCVFLAGAHTSAVDFARLRRLLTALPTAAAPDHAATASFPLPRPEQALCLRDAVLSPSQSVLLEEAVGCVCGSLVAPCPPGIPLVIPGERLDNNLCTALQKYGISRINVIK